ncbi:MAG: RagB/SusD family nutrient uptake outer membrane protein [Cyclobacteriaceae bacterium]|nr:RagB/SusD family nutrient uptake outer membrane protein [Cyclobacteriaceae bacterium]
MKKIFFRRNVGMAIIMLLAISCNEDFLNVKVQGGVTNDPALVQKFVTGTYNSLTQGDCFSNGDVHGWGFISVTCTISDDADKGSTAGDQAVPIGDLDNFTTTSTNKFCETMWSGHYIGIGAANETLNLMNTASTPLAQKKIYQGEIRFIRGYLYFNMVRMFGDVPLVLRVPKNLKEAETDPVYATRAPKAQVYDSIIQDLQFAVDNLPIKSQAVAGHVTKGTAQTLLAKVYMYLGDWAKVKALTDAVIASNQYSLVPDYATIWRQVGDNNAESIFEIQTGKFNNANLKIDNYIVSQGPRVGGMGGWDDLGYGFNNPTPDLINTYETGDLRKAATVIFIDNSGTHKGTTLWDGRRIPSSDSVQNLYYNYKAYTSMTKEEFANKLDKDRPKNVRILRYAEVLLMNAEAAFHTGGDVLTNLNKIRQRAGLAPKGSATLDDIWKERRLEFAMEHDRFWDLVRQGRVGQVLRAAGKTNFVDGKHELLPVPNSQILLSGGKLTQNPGY